eukprot:GHVU01095947.1.p1 GENE.GHVU01095947.1~~GHVU01095947.1.p1  ORF type:complete len:107 (-),score=0.15 GHVU01095947.1:73-393(-)
MCFYIHALHTHAHMHTHMCANTQTHPHDTHTCTQASHACTHIHMHTQTRTQGPGTNPIYLGDKSYLNLVLGKKYIFRGLPVVVAANSHDAVLSEIQKDGIATAVPI